MKDRDLKAGESDVATARRPYVPPAIEETSAFETLALACGKNPEQCGNYYAPDPSQYHGS